MATTYTPLFSGAGGTTDEEPPTEDDDKQSIQLKQLPSFSHQRHPSASASSSRPSSQHRRKHSEEHYTDDDEDDELEGLRLMDRRRLRSSRDEEGETEDDTDKESIREPPLYRGGIDVDSALSMVQKVSL